MQDIVVEMLNIAKGFAIRADGVAGDIRSMHDDDGDETSDVSRVMYVLVQWRDDQRWSPVFVADFRSQTTH